MKTALRVNAAKDIKNQKTSLNAEVIGIIKAKEINMAGLQALEQDNVTKPEADDEKSRIEEPSARNDGRRSLSGIVEAGSVGKRMTVKELAEITGAAYSTAAAYAQKAGWTENGKQTLLDEKQAAIIVEAMKQGHAGGPNNAAGTLQTSLEGVETAQSRAVRIVVLARRQQEIDRQIQAELEAEIAELKAKSESDRPKVEFFDQVADSPDALQMRDVAAALNIPNMGRNKLFEALRKRGVLDERNIPYREYQDQGYFRVVEQKWTDKEGETHISLKTLVYQRGLDFIRKALKHGGMA